MNNINVCIHIGLSKTATSTLQNQFFPRHPDVEYLGKYNLANPQSKHKFYTEYRTNLFEQIQNKNLNDERVNALKQIFHEIIQPTLDLTKLLVVSSEGFSTGDLSNRIRRANNFKAIFGPCKILIILREPIDLIESLYFQKLKEYNLRDQALWRKYPNCFSIEQWLKKHWKSSLSGPLWHLDYYQTIEAYANIFGMENIGIFLFEQLKQEPASFLEHICEFTGIDAKHNSNIFRNSQDNVRWNEDNLDKLRRIQSSFLQSLKFCFYTTQQRKNALGLTDPEGTTASKKAEATIHDHWKTRIQEYTEPGNRLLKSKWGLPLEQYNYPL